MRRDDIRRLSEQRKTVFATMHKLNEDAEKENRSLSGEEKEQFDKMATEFEDLTERETRATKLFMQEREVEKTLATPLEKRIGDDGDAPATFGEYRERTLGTRPQDQPEVRSAYWKYMTVGSLSELDVEEQRAISRASGAAGNFLVPTDFYNQIIRSLRFMGSVAQLCTEYVTDNGDSIQVPANTAHGTACGRLRTRPTRRRTRRSRRSRSAPTRPPRRSSSPRSCSRTRRSRWTRSSPASSASGSASSRTPPTSRAPAPASRRACSPRRRRRTSRP
jgi:predicted phage gp36 major capsid-like protein